jgi:dTDP-4-amino-4,6-dideoxygalactose transaminase
MDAIMEVAERHGLDVVEDNAHGLLGRFRGRPLGTFGALATLSFHETKNISCGEGGALIINDGRYVDRADVISQKGTNRTSFARGEVSKYTWVDIGSSYQLSDLLAAFLYAQLESRELLQATRKQIWQRYRQHLEIWAKEHGVRLPYVPVHCEQSFHLFYLIMPNHEQRQALIAHLQQRGIHSVFHYQPLHLSEMGRRFGGQAGDCPVTEDISRRLVRLPFFNDLTEAQQMQVIEAVRSFDGTAPGISAWSR